MTAGGGADHRRLSPTAALTQRQRELLALYAASPPGERLGRFCKRAGLHRDTWWTWRTTHRAFAAELERIQQERVQLALEPLRAALPRLAVALIRKAEAGNVPALRTVGDWLGFSRRGGPAVAVAVDVGAVPEKSLDELLAERKRLAEIVDDYIDRHREDGEERVQEHDDGAGAS